jgi:hypothetical protein
VTANREVERLLLGNWESLNLDALHWLVGTLLALRRLRDPALPARERNRLLRAVRATAAALEVDP